MKIPEGKKRELCPEGTHSAALVQILDMGTQPSANPKFKPSRRVLLGYELFGLKTEEGDAFVLFKNYNFTSNEKSSLMKDIKAWTGIKTADFNLEDFLSKPALLTVVHNEAADGNTYANIENISGLPKGMKPGKVSTPLRTLFLEPGEFDEATFKELGEKLQGKIAASEEYAECKLALESKGKKKAPAAPAKTATGKKK